MVAVDIICFDLLRYFDKVAEVWYLRTKGIFEPPSLTLLIMDIGSMWRIN